MPIITLEEEAELIIGCEIDKLVGEIENTQRQMTLQKIEGKERKIEQRVVIEVAK